MKKLNFSQKKWHQIRAKNQYKRKFRKKFSRLVSIWKDGEHFFAISTRSPTALPEIMCLERNTILVSDTLERLRRRLLNVKKNPVWMREVKNGKPRIKGYFDFSPIQEISTSAALVLAAEYERAISIVGNPPPVINIEDWQPEVRNRLGELGFFPLLGIEQSALEGSYSDQSNTIIIPFISGSNASETENADAMLIELAEFLDPDKELSPEISVPLLSALSEAMTNVRLHAYPHNHKFNYPHMSRWWLTGSADRANRRLTLVIYDQGASIPITYPRISHGNKVTDWIKTQVSIGNQHSFAHDGIQIEAAAKFGNSQTGKANQGRGIPDMHDAIDACGKGSLMILSRGGKYLYKGNENSERSWFPSSIGGTLIEWSIELPSEAKGI